ncbi:hypothetical protein FJR11_00700 [Anabaena sp. UHCC 0187]|uniref:hypothetical protein n=1 Tax=Anabaena sp. UHCC 0187 TaxID=2590018 RepID=UPI00144549C8|nr:hypothetical protein [Anabaena sp. UHCC 0187]MTJ11139.1 hypothetical protein [Anabaena sp. UHCC 0187]
MLKSEHPEDISSLKDFLTIVPSREKIKQILITAINQLIDTEPQKIYWLFKNPTYLQPEIDIKIIVTQKLNEKLLAWEFKPEDIHFNENGNLEFNAAAKDRLMSTNYSSDNYAVLKLVQLFLTEEI